MYDYSVEAGASVTVWIDWPTTPSTLLTPGLHDEFSALTKCNRLFGGEKDTHATNFVIGWDFEKIVVFIKQL
jgi:hypothetical protein